MSCLRPRLRRFWRSYDYLRNGVRANTSTWYDSGRHLWDCTTCRSLASEGSKISRKLTIASRRHLPPKLARPTNCIRRSCHVSSQSILSSSLINISWRRHRIHEIPQAKQTLPSMPSKWGFICAASCGDFGWLGCGSCDSFARYCQAGLCSFPCKPGDCYSPTFSKAIHLITTC